MKSTVAENEVKRKLIEAVSHRLSFIDSSLSYDHEGPYSKECLDSLGSAGAYLLDMISLCGEYHRHLDLAPSIHLGLIDQDAVKEVSPELAQKVNTLLEERKKKVSGAEIAQNFEDAVHNALEILEDLTSLPYIPLPKQVSFQETINSSALQDVVRDIQLLNLCYYKTLSLALSNAEIDGEDDENPEAIKTGYQSAYLWVQEAANDLLQITTENPYIVQKRSPLSHTKTEYHIQSSACHLN